LICPQCQTDNPTHIGFCSHCGFRFGTEGVAADSPPAGKGPVRKGLAIASLVLGVLSLLTCSLFLIGGLAGIALGITALVKRSNRPDQYGGAGMALAGIVLNALSFCVSIVAAIAIPNLLKSRQAANEAVAIIELRTIVAAEYTHFSMKNGYGSLEELASEGLVGRMVASGTNSGYQIRVRVKGNSFEATAIPQSAGTFGTGNRSFYTSSDAIIRSAPGSREATGSDPPIEDFR
jgi:type IV pilus assembly protein PilA